MDIYSLSSADHDFADLRPFAHSHTVLDFKPAKLFQSPWGRINQVIRLADLARIRRRNAVVSDLIEKNGYDVLLAHPCQFENTPSILSQVKNFRTVYYCHEPLRLIYEQMPYRPYNQLEMSRRRLLNRIDPLPSIYQATLRRNDARNIRKADKVLVNSQFIHESVARIYGVNSQVSYHGVDHHLFQPQPVEKRHMLLSVGSLTPLKGFDFLIRAVGELPVTQRPVLVIASNFQNPPERSYLVNLAQECGVRLELEGNVSDERLVELYNLAKMTVYAPLAEPFGLVPLESMACATPVVAVDEGGIRETMMHQQTGLLVQRDPVEFAEAIGWLLSNAKVAREMGANGREHVTRNWSWDRAITTLEQHLTA